MVVIKLLKAGMYKWLQMLQKLNHLQKMKLKVLNLILHPRTGILFG